MSEMQALQRASVGCYDLQQFIFRRDEVLQCQALRRCDGAVPQYMPQFHKGHVDEMIDTVLRHCES